MNRYLVRIKLAIYVSVILAVFSHTNYIYANIYADFGKGCPGIGLPVGSELQYLQDNTIYGDIKKSIDVTTYISIDPVDNTTNCNNNKENIKICIINSALDKPPCDMASFDAGGAAVPLSSISKDPSLGLNPLLSTLTLRAQYIGDPSCNKTRNTDKSDSWTCKRFLCLTMPTPYGDEPLVCKQIISVSPAPPPVDTPPTCKLVADSCSKSEVTQSLFTFTGPAVECLTDTLHYIFFDPQPDCVGETDINLSFLASFASFQESLKVSVRALLILYTMGYGITLMMNPGKLSAEGVVMFVLKMILVGYFSVGWGPAYFTSNGTKQTHSGMLEWGLPILTQMTSDLASIAFLSGNSGRGICEFDNSHYPAGYGYFGLWDRIDCRLGAYLMVKKIYGFGFLNAHSFSNGYNEISTMTRDNTDPISSVDLNGSAANSASQIGMSVIMFLLLLGGNIIIVIGLMYFLCIILSLILGFVSLYTVCLVTLHVLIYISPIFVPMALFQRTKTYFDSWLKVTLSCALQPMIVAGFLAFVMNMYDDVFFGGCEFRRHDYSNGTRFFSIFEPRLPQGNYESCVITPGFMIINYVLGYGWSDYGAIFFTVDFAKDELNLLANTCLLIVFSYIMGFFLDVVYGMASDLTGGLNISGVALNMKNMARAMQNKLSNAKDIAARVGGGTAGMGGSPPPSMGSKEDGDSSPGEGSGSSSPGEGGGSSPPPSMGDGGGGSSPPPSMGGGGGIK
jgi:type IV secretion system protein VirB6